MRKRGIPVAVGRDGFSPIYGTIFLRQEVMGGRTLRDLALAAHEVAHALRFRRKARTALLASQVVILRWMLFGSGLTLVFLLNPAAIAVLALAYGIGLLLIPACFPVRETPSGGRSHPGGPSHPQGGGD